MSLGKRIQECREALGISQSALAKRLGVSQSTVGNYEAGISFPKEEVLLRLFDSLETDPNTLFSISMSRLTPPRSARGAFSARTRFPLIRSLIASSV